MNLLGLHQHEWVLRLGFEGVMFWLSPLTEVGMVEYSPLPDSYLDEYRSTLSYAFNPTAEQYDPEEAEELAPPGRVGDRRGLFDGETLVSVCSNLYFDTKIRDNWQTMAGLSAVATPPEFRRRGHVKTMLRNVLEEYRNKGAYISSLWAFSEPFYAQYGWAISNRQAIQEGPPGAFSFTRELSGGEFYQAEPDEWESLNEVVLEHGDGYELTIDRTEKWWRNRVFHGWQTDPYVYAWEAEGSIEGYIVYDIDETESGNAKLQVWDLAWTHRTAKLHLLRFIANHEDHVDSVGVKGPSDELFMNELEDPAKLSYQIKPGAMIRLVDVEEAIKALEYESTLDLSFTMEVVDQFADWNDGTYSIDIHDGQATVSESENSPDLSIPIGALSQLYVGYRGVDSLHNQGELKVNDPEIKSHISRIFPKRPVYLREKF